MIGRLVLARGILCVLAAVQVACGGGDDPPISSQTSAPSEPTTPSPPTSLTVPLATCGPDDQPEKGLQGQVPMSERAKGFTGYSCNLKKVSSVPAPDLGYRQFATVRDRSGRLCGYAGGANSLGSFNTMVVDMSNPDQLVQTAVLSTPAMMNPGEGLRTHAGRGLLISAHYNATRGASNEAHGLDVYDVGTDCRYPQLLATTTLKFKTTGLPEFPGTGPWPTEDAAFGHEGAISTDGLTYYIGDYPHNVYHAVDITDPTQPVLLSTFMPPSATGLKDPITGQGVVHGLSVSNDGNRAYFTTGAIAFRNDAMVPQTGEWRNGFLVVDTSQVQARLPNPKMRLIFEENYHDNAAEQMTIPFTVKGNRYLLSTGESGTGMIGPKGKKQACAAGLTPFGIARIYNLDDESNPVLVKKIILEVNDPKNCSLVAGEIDSTYGLLYDSHMCSVDNRDEATTLVCSHFQSGIRVFDIREPANVKEVAYYNPPSVAGPGKALPLCGAISTLDASAGRLYSACGGIGVMSLKFTNSIWPFVGSSTPDDKQL
ncbi:LVIVD repeat-containing protein [Cupriavidus necator]